MLATVHNDTYLLRHKLTFNTIADDSFIEARINTVVVTCAGIPPEGTVGHRQKIGRTQSSCYWSYDLLYTISPSVI